MATAFLAWEGIAASNADPRQIDAVLPGLILLLVPLAAIGLVVALEVRFSIKPFEELADSRAHLQVLYTEAQEDAMHDGLTGLGNHRAFQEELSRQVALYHRRSIGFVLMLIDIDNLKAVNDANGHAEGDRMIVNLASTMREMFRDSDRLFRIGGDEFAVIMSLTDVDHAYEAAGRLQHFALLPRSGVRPTSISGGISAVPRFAANRDQAYRQADAALYWAKRHGRATIEIFDGERDMVDDVVTGEGVANAVHEIVKSRLVSAVFQPFVDLRSGNVIGFEGLVRPNPSGRLSNASQLFAAASATGWTVELDMACLGVVAAGAKLLARDSLLSVNLSSRTLELKHFDTAWLLDPLRRYSIPPERVIVELTERDAIGDLRRLHRNVSALQAQGLRIAADDVGAGNSGLRLLSQVRFDFVKLDLSLVHASVQHADARAVLRSLRDIAASQGAVVIAEGLETPEQLWLVQDLGIPVGQGFLLGRPGVSLQLAPRELPKASRYERVAIAVDPAPAKLVRAALAH